MATLPLLRAIVVATANMAASHALVWLEKLKNAEKTCIIANGKRKFHYLFPDGEMAEEYDLATKLLLVRKWRRRTAVGSLKRWEYEIGEPPVELRLDDDGIREDTSNPFFYRADTEGEFQWKIRNMPYPLNTYEVTAVGPDENVVVVKTTNKKYYKKFSIPELERCGLPIDPTRLNVSHAANTLRITYKKPPEVFALESEICKLLSKLKAINQEDDGISKP